MTLQKYFSHPSSVIYFFPTPQLILKPGLQLGGRLLIATHLYRSTYLANQQQVLGLDVHLTSFSKLCKNARPKPFCCAKPACFDFSSSNFNLQGHIPSTGKVALKSWKNNPMFSTNVSICMCVRNPRNWTHIKITPQNFSNLQNPTVKTSENASNALHDFEDLCLSVLIIKVGSRRLEARCERLDGYPKRQTILTSGSLGDRA